MSDNPPMTGPPSRYPTKAEDWLYRVENRLWGEIEKLEPKPHDHGTNSALVGVGFALLEVRDELRRMNDGRDQFHREVLEVLTAAKDVDGSLRSEQPAAAPGCQVCGKPGAVTRCVVGPLTYEQWQAHRAWLYQEWRDKGKVKSAAQGRAADTMLEYFGPCPEES